MVYYVYVKDEHNTQEKCASNLVRQEVELLDDLDSRPGSDFWFSVVLQKDEDYNVCMTGKVISGVLNLRVTSE